jgi:hypothetical protein
MNRTQSPVRPPVAPPIPAIPVSTKPEPLSDYAQAQRAAAPQVPPLEFLQPLSPDATEPDPWKAMASAQERSDKLRGELAAISGRLEESKAEEAKLVANDSSDEEELVRQVSAAQARVKVLAARHTRLLSQEQEARRDLRTRIDCARISLEQEAQALRAQRVAAHLEMLAKRIAPLVSPFCQSRWPLTM